MHELITVHHLKTPFLISIHLHAPIMHGPEQGFMPVKLYLGHLSQLKVTHLKSHLQHMLLLCSSNHIHGLFTLQELYKGVPNLPMSVFLPVSMQ